MSENPATWPPELVAAKVQALEAEALQYRAEARRDEALAKQAELEATAGVIGLAREQEKRQRELMSDYETRFYRFHKTVNADTARSCISMLAQWFRVDKANGVEAPHYKIQFNSPGGNVTEGLALFDEIQHFRRQGVRVTTSTIGMAASMAGILLQAGDERVMAPESWMLIHKTSFGAMGDFVSVADQVKWLERVQDRIVDIFVRRAAEAGERETADKPITKRQLEARWNRKDWWISSDEALELGLVDAVR
jgi:ATP-dependent Clp endopeptidase proteolytic subunit ClpP